MHKLQPTLPCSPLSFSPSLSLSHCEWQVEWPFVSSWVTLLLSVETAFVLIRCCALLLCIFFLFKFNFSALHFLRRPEVRPSRRRKVQMDERETGAWHRGHIGGEEGEAQADSLPTVAVSSQQKMLFSLGRLPASNSESPLSSLPLLPSLFVCLFWYIFEFGNLVICNLLSFFRNLSGRCMLNATREIT